MNDKQRLFVDEYITSLNATQAAMKAGYDAHSAYSQGHRLLKNAEVQKAVETAMKDRATRTAVNADYVIHRLQVITERSMDGVKPDYKSALRALELLGKHLGLFAPSKELQDFQFKENDVTVQIRRILLEQSERDRQDRKRQDCK